MNKNHINVLFAVASCLELALGILDECDWELVGTRYILWGCMFVYILKMCSNNYTNVEKIIFLELMCVGVGLYVSSGINTGIKIPVYIFALKGTDVRKCYKWLLISIIAVIACVATANLIYGFGTSFIYDVRMSRGFSGKRYSFGFINPNRFQIYVFAVMVFALGLWNDWINIWVRISIGIVYGLTCYMSDSYSGIIIGAFMYVMFFALKYVKWDKWRYVLTVGVVFSLLFFVVFSIIVATGAREGLVGDINYFISGRMNQIYKCNNGDMYLTGEIDNWRMFATSLHKNVYDLGYIQLFYYYGIIPGICYLAFIFYSVYAAWKKQNNLVSLVIWGFSIYLFMEAAYFSNFLQRDFLMMSAAYAVMDGGLLYEGLPLYGRLRKLKNRLVGEYV